MEITYISNSFNVISGGSMNNLDQNDTNRTPVKPKKSVLGTPRLNSNNPFAMRSNVLGSPKLGSGVLLRPSALGSKLENKSENAKNPFSLNPSRLNPFAKVEIPAAAATEAVTTTEDTNNVSPEDKPTPATTSTSNDKDKSQATTVEANNGTSAAAETPKFVPLAVTETSTRGTTATVSATSTPNFVFGQNLHERVISESENAGEGMCAYTLLLIICKHYVQSFLQETHQNLSPQPVALMRTVRQSCCLAAPPRTRWQRTQRKR